MQAFWDQRAREDPYFFVDTRRAYRDPELASFWANGQRDLDRLLAAVGVTIEPTDTVLDIGCGVGRLTRPIATRAAQAAGIDISAEMLERAREHHSDLDNVEWILGDGTSLHPVEDESVEACVSHVVFQHVPDPNITLDYVREMGRVLRPGGWSAFQVSNASSAHERRDGLRALSMRLRAAVGRAPRGQRDPAWLGSAVDLDDLRAAGAEGGLQIERVVGGGTSMCVVLARRSDAR